MREMFNKTFILKKNKPQSGSFSDDEDNYEISGDFSGYIRTLGSSETVAGREGATTTHRLYTEYEDIDYGDLVYYGSRDYRVVFVDLKKEPFGPLRFYQVDLEAII